MLRVVSRLLELRSQLPVLIENRFVHGRSQPGAGLPDIAWFGPDGNELNSDQWANPEERTLVCAAPRTRRRKRSKSSCCV
jgi:glycogen operon protein